MATLLPEWLQQLADECPPEDIRQLDKTMNKTQVERDRRHRAKKTTSGLKRVEVWVPLDRVDELKSVARAMRDA